VNAAPASAPEMPVAAPTPKNADVLALVRRRLAAHQHLQTVAIENGAMERARQHDAVIDELHDLVAELERGQST
jgi:hypothetical protein